MPGDILISRLQELLMEPFGDAVTEGETGAILSLDVTPASGKAGFFTGYDPWRKSIRCAVRSPPNRGKANREVTESLARALGIPPSSVQILSGATRSRKRILAKGIRRAAVLQVLARFL
jgi:uncharacterized protein (TIGR00251 family)